MKEGGVAVLPLSVGDTAKASLTFRSRLAFNAAIGQSECCCCSYMCAIVGPEKTPDVRHAARGN